MKFASMRYAGRALARLGRLITAVCAGALPCASMAVPVWVTHPHGEGQGYVFVIANTCYAYTAGHVVSSAKGPIALIDRNGYRADATLVQVDPVLDLALVRVGRTADEHRRLCSTKSVPMLRLDPIISAIRNDRWDAWIDLIGSPAGGLDRFSLAMGPDAGDPNVLLLSAAPASRAGEESRLPRQGNSGATLWVAPRGSVRGLFDKDGAPSLRAKGAMLGVLVSVRDRHARTVRSDRVHEFVANAIQPVAWGDISLRPGHVRAVGAVRGAVPRIPRQAAELPLSDAMLDRLGFVLDLGDSDTLVKGITVELGPRAAGTLASRRRTDIRVWSSQYRPDAAELKWTGETCRMTPTQKAPSSPGGMTIEKCALQNPRVARGLIVEVSGDPSALRGVSVDTGR